MVGEAFCNQSDDPSSELAGEDEVAGDDDSEQEGAKLKIKGRKSMLERKLS